MAKDKSGFMSVDIGGPSDVATGNYGLLAQAGASRGKGAEIAGMNTAETISFLGKVGATAYEGYQFLEAADEAKRTMSRVNAPDQGWVGEAAAVSIAKEEQMLKQKDMGPQTAEFNAELDQIQNARMQNAISPARAQAEMAAKLRQRIADNPGMAQTIRAAYEKYTGKGDYDIQEYRRALDLEPAQAAARHAKQQQDAVFAAEAKNVLVPLGPEGAYRAAMPSEIAELYKTGNFSTTVGIAYLQSKKIEANERDKKDLDNVAAINKERGMSTASPKIQSISLSLDSEVTKIHGALATMTPMLSQNDATMMGEFSALRNKAQGAFATARAQAVTLKQEVLASGKPWAGAAAKEVDDYIEKLDKQSKGFLDIIMENPKSAMEARKIIADTNNATAQEIGARVKFLEPLLKFTSDAEKTLLLSEAGRQQILSGKHPQFKEGGQVFLMAQAIDDEVKATTSMSQGMRKQAESSAARLEQGMAAYKQVMGALSPEKAKQELAHLNDADRKALATTANNEASKVLKNVVESGKVGQDGKPTSYVPSNEGVNTLFISADNFDDSKERLTTLESGLQSGKLPALMGERYETYKNSVVGRASTWLFGDGDSYLPSRVRSLLTNSNGIEVKDGVLVVKADGTGSVQNRLRLNNDVEKANLLISIQSSALGMDRNEVAQQFMSKMQGLKPGQYNRMSTAYSDANAQLKESAVKALMAIPGYATLDSATRTLLEESLGGFPTVKTSKEQRANNFLNIRVPGKEEFQTFASPEHAVQVFNKQLDRYAAGKTDGVKRTTVDQIIGLWSNEKEKGSMSHKGYLDVIKKRVGLSPDDVIDTPEKRAQLIYGMQFAELGTERVKKETINKVLGISGG